MSFVLEKDLRWVLHCLKVSNQNSFFKQSKRYVSISNPF